MTSNATVPTSAKFLLILVAASAAFISSGREATARDELPRVGVLSLVTEAGEPPYIKIVYRGMEKLGWIAGKNIVYVRPQSFDDPARFADAARELVRSKVDLIYADSAPAMRAAQAATREIPIVGTDYTNDPVAVGYAKTYHRPGGNITGVFLDAPQFAGNWIDLLRTILPDLKRAVALYDPSPGDRHLKALQAAARAAGIQLQIVEVHKPEDIDRAATMTLPGTPQAIIIVPSPMTYAENTRLARLARKQKLPATSMAPHFAGKGGLLAYGPDNSIVERLAVQISKILNGANPGDLPIERPHKFELVINLKTANALGLTIPDAVVFQADRLIR